MFDILHELKEKRLAAAKGVENADAYYLPARIREERFWSDCITELETNWERRRPEAGPGATPECTGA